MAAVNASRRVIVVPDGFELAHYTLKRVYDGHMQSYLPINATATPVQAIPMADYLSDIHLSTAGSPSPVPIIDHASHQNQQLVRGGHGDRTQPDNRARGLSAMTQRRHAHSRDDMYTTVCGVFSLAKGFPVRKYNPGNGEFCCPRCKSNFTRPKSVKDHFPHCVLKFGNPQALRFTDHPSMARTEAYIERNGQSSREVSNAITEEDDAERSGSGQGIDFEEMNETLARTSIDRDAPSHDGPHIKTEFVFGADIPHESIETPMPEHQFGARYTSLRRSTSLGSNMYIAQTPDWQTATSPRTGSTTPTPRTNPWNIGIPGSAAEHAIMDMRATAPCEGWPHEAQTPKPTHGNGFQGDGLDGYMDRRSHFSPTPAAFQLSSRTGVYEEECEMKD